MAGGAAGLGRVRDAGHFCEDVEDQVLQRAQRLARQVERVAFLLVGALASASCVSFRFDRATVNVPPTTSAGTGDTTAARTASVIFDPVTLATAEKRLAQYVGPLAKVLIKRAANDSGDLGELYRKLAEHIDSERERGDFLKGLG